MVKLKQLLLIPGPTPTPTQVRLAGAEEMINHRSADFKKIYEETIENLRWAYQTKNDIFILPSSGTGGMEAAVANCISPGDKVLVLVTGAFGQRFAGIAKAYNANVETIEFDAGKAVDIQKLKERLDSDKNKEIKAVLFQQNETSTAVINPVQKIAELVQAHGALIIVDAVSGMLATDMKTDQWGLDVVVSGSQKAFMMAPGIALVSVSAKAYSVIEKNKNSRFYFDLLKYREFSKKGETPWTPPISLIYSLHKSLQILKQEGLESIFRRHQLLKKAVRSAAQSLGFDLLVKDEAVASNSVSAIVPMNGIDAEQLRKTCREHYGVILAGGQGALTGKIFRIGHLGYVDQLDILAAFSAIEMTLYRLGHKKFSLGTSVKAIQEILLEASLVKA